MKKNIGAMTLVELIISVTISAIVLLFLVAYVSDVLGIIGKSRNYTDNMKNIMNFTQDFQKYYYKYPVVTKFDAGTNSIGNDYLVMKDIENTDGILVGIIQGDTKQLVTSAQALEYSNQHIAVRYLSAGELTTLNTSTTFQTANIYGDFYVKDLDVNILSLGSGSVLDMNLNIFNTYSDELFGTKFSDLDSELFIPLNFSF